MLKHIPYVFILIVFFSSCEEANQGISRVDKIIQIQQQIADNPVDSVYFRLKRAQKLLASMPNAPDSLQAENNYLLGLHFRKEKKADSAAIYFHNAIGYINNTITNNRQIEYFQSAWSEYLSLGKYGDCITILEKYKSLLDEDWYPGPFSWAYFNEETTYVHMRKYKRALEINEERVSFAREKDTNNLPVALISQSKLKIQYFRDYDGAATILDELLIDKDKLSDNIKGQIFSTYGVLTYYRGDFQGALEYYLNSISHIKIQKESNTKFNNLINEYNNAAEVSIDLKQYEYAKLYLDTIRGYGLKNLSRNQQKVLLSYELRYAMENQKSSKRALSIVDSIYNNLDKVYYDKLNNELLALTKANEKEKVLLAEKQVSELENLKLQTRLLLLGIGFLLLGSIGYFVYRQRKFGFEKQQLQMQQRLLRSQMNPHFTFNTLAAIQNKIKTDGAAASKYLVKFSRLLRLILENSMQNYVQLEKETDSLRKYLELQLLRFPETFTYEITLNKLEEDELIFIPPMLIQPFVENSIEHGFKGISYVGHISVKLVKMGTFIQCTIEDNGIGMNNSVSDQKTSSSVKLISDFIENATKKKVSVLNKEDHQNTSGVIITFLMPTKLTEND